jgi:hypothetical protein
MWPSSGEITVSMRHLVFVTLCGMKLQFHSTLHTRQSSTQSDKYQVSHSYSYFSWWWAHSRPKHVKKRNKRAKKNCAPSSLYLTRFYKVVCQQTQHCDNRNLFHTCHKPQPSFQITSYPPTICVSYLPTVKLKIIIPSPSRYLKCNFPYMHCSSPPPL